VAQRSNTNHSLSNRRDSNENDFHSTQTSTSESFTFNFVSLLWLLNQTHGHTPPIFLLEQITGPGQFFDFWLLILYDFGLCDDGGTRQINFIGLLCVGPIKFQPGMGAERKFPEELLCNENKLCLIESCWIGNGFGFEFSSQ